MAASNQFNGITMPVFAAFGWAGEETALNYALEQLELFVNTLYFSLPRHLQTLFTGYGLDRNALSVYLSTADQPETDLHVAFYARPMSLEISLALTDKAALQKAYRAVEGQVGPLYGMLQELGADWNLRLQQMEFDSDTGIATHYQDVYKDTVGNLDPVTAKDAVERAAFLNSEAQWVVPIYLSRRFDSEKIAAMGPIVIDRIGEEIGKLEPMARLLTGKVKKPRAKAKPVAKARPRPVIDVEETVIPQASMAADLDEFTYVAELKPLHLRRGFVNLTPNHWPFFAENARTETRKVTLKYDDKTDKASAVWRLVPNDQARIVLSSEVQRWLEDQFQPDDPLKVTAVKIDDTITITLTPLH
jgi:hypothetical protein